MIGIPQSPRNVTDRHKKLFLSKKPLDTQWSARRKSMRKSINTFRLFRYHCNRGSTNRVCVATSGKCTFVSVSATASVSVSVSFKPNPFQVHDVWSEQSAFNDSTLGWYPWWKIVRNINDRWWNQILNNNIDRPFIIKSYYWLIYVKIVCFAFKVLRVWDYLCLELRG